MSQSVPETSPKLSAADRLTLIQTLNALPSAQFEELLIALNPPKGNIPTNAAAQAMRSKALFEWVESPIGPGIPELETILGMIISKETKTSPEFLSFAISGTISSNTVAEVRAIVELLRKKTGDDSIDVAFFKKGSIKIILTGSPEGLQKIQELFESGELENVDNKPVEVISHIDNNTDSRKIRLVQILSLASNSGLALDLDRARISIRASTRNLADISYFNRDVVSRHIFNLVFTLTRIRTRTYSISADLSQTLDRTYTYTLDLADALDTLDLDLAHTYALEIERCLNHIIANTIDLNYNRQLNLEHADLTNTNLRNTNLRQANLTKANFTRADLTGANLTGANLTETILTGAEINQTIFGENRGLTVADKIELQQRGAILLDPPNSDVPSLVRV